MFKQNRIITGQKKCLFRGENVSELKESTLLDELNQTIRLTEQSRIPHLFDETVSLEIKETLIHYFSYAVRQ